VVCAAVGVFLLLVGRLNGATPTATIVNSSLNPSTYGSLVTFIATITPSSNGPPTGTVLFTFDGVQQVPIPVTASGSNATASLSLSSLSAGTHTVTAQYSGDASYNASGGILTVSQTVNKAALSITANNDSKLVGGTKTYGIGMTAFTSVGLQNGETIGSVSILASGGTSPGSPVGTYNLTPSAATGGTFNSSNYTITYVNGILTVKPLPPPLRIMPVGDSITYGNGYAGALIAGGYRYPLYNLLFNAGYNPGFVGTQTGNPGPGNIAVDHEGHGGWEIAQIDSIISGAFDSIEDPDVILLLIGTNDYGLNDQTGNATNRLESLIAKMAIARPFAKIIVANLLIRNEPYNTQIQTTFNPYLPGIVARQQALGRSVYFDDMRSAVPVADIDSTPLHPTQAGYKDMATNWFGIITNLFTPVGSFDAPAISRVIGLTNLTNVVVTFSKPINTNTAGAANFSITGGLVVQKTSLDPVGLRKVTLTTTPQQPQTSYTVTVNGVIDQNQNPIASNSAFTFQSSPIRGATNNVPEAAGYQLVYSLNIPTLVGYPSDVTYTIDQRASVTQFSRVAYYLELETIYGELNYLWVSMDPFTTNVNRIGLPTMNSGAIFKQVVTNLNVFSSLPGLVTGTRLSGGAIQFSPNNYSQATSLGVSNAGDSTAWGNTIYNVNYGSMELVNTTASQILFAFDNWAGVTTNADFGIGNNGDRVDWTYSGNTGSYSVKTLQVYVSPLPNYSPTLGIRINGSNIAFYGSNGPAFGSYVILGSTNLALPVTLWTPVSSNLLDNAGSFAWTNSFGASSGSFFRLEVQ